MIMKKLLSILFFLTLAAQAQASSVYIIAPDTEAAKAIQYSSIVETGTLINKPVCNSGMDPRIFVFPAVALGGNESPLNAISAINTFAEDGGVACGATPCWKVRGEVLAANNLTYEQHNSGDPQQFAPLKMIVFTRCCNVGTDCE